MDSEGENRKAAVQAHESSEPRVGYPPEASTLEQFLFLFESEPGLLPIDPVNWQGWGEGKKKPPSPNRERWGTCYTEVRTALPQESCGWVALWSDARFEGVILHPLELAGLIRT
jgi:hypothetical protein